ncbi:MAG: hypothetical protein RLY78_2030 [Pseudomonadota bacterium]
MSTSNHGPGAGSVAATQPDGGPPDPPTDCAQRLRAALGALSPDLQRAAGAARSRRLAAGQVLLAPGQVWDRLWIVTDGALRLYHLDRRGRTATKNFFLPGALLWPVTPGLQRQPSAFCVEAVTPCEVWQLDWAGWSTAAAPDPHWQALQLRTLTALLEDKMERERQFLHCDATERWRLLQERHADWVQALPLRHLASWLGITDVALSRIRRRLNPG